MWDEVVVVYKTDKKKGLRLTIIEVEMLLFLFEQTFLTQKQLYRFYSTYVTTTKNSRYDSFKNRVAKFVKLGLIDVHEYKINKKRHGASMNILQLNEKGFRLLVKSGFLENRPYVPPTINKWDRILAAKEVLLHAVQFELKVHGALQSWNNDCLYIADPVKAKNFDKIQDQHLSYYPTSPIVIHEEHLFSEDMLYKKKKNLLLPDDKLALSVKKQGSDNPAFDIVEPDWLFRIKNKYFFVQIDLGYRYHTRRKQDEVNQQFTISETIEKIIQKVPKGVPINMIYVQVDDSFLFSRFYYNQAKRTMAIKTQINPELLENPFLSLYVCTLSRSKDVITTLLDTTWGYQDNYITRNLLDIFEEGIAVERERNIVISREVELLSSKENITFPLFNHLNIEDVFLVNEKEVYTRRKKYYIPFEIREGDLTAQYQVLVLAKQLRQYQHLLDEKDIEVCVKILAIYPDCEQLDNDIHRDDLACKEIIFCSIDNIPISAILNDY